MKTLVCVMFFGLALLVEAVDAQSPEVSLTTCQQLARDFGENPDALITTQLNQLQFCLTQVLATREATDPPSMLQGTIIESLPSSDTGASPSAPHVNSND